MFYGVIRCINVTKTWFYIFFTEHAKINVSDFLEAASWKNVFNPLIASVALI